MIEKKLEMQNSSLEWLITQPQLKTLKKSTQKRNILLIFPIGHMIVLMPWKMDTLNQTVKIRDMLIKYECDLLRFIIVFIRPKLLQCM